MQNDRVEDAVVFICRNCIDRERIGGARSGLASRGATPQYSPALRWVTTGFGMGPGGATALWATSPPDGLRVECSWCGTNTSTGGVISRGGTRQKLDD